jgi:hypothetical protein
MLQQYPMTGLGNAASQHKTRLAVRKGPWVPLTNLLTERPRLITCVRAPCLDSSINRSCLPVSVCPRFQIHQAKRLHIYGLLGLPLTGGPAALGTAIGSE